MASASLAARRAGGTSVQSAALPLPPGRGGSPHGGGCSSCLDAAAARRYFEAAATTGVSRAEAERIARRYAEEEGWPWNEPVRVFSAFRTWRMFSNADYRVATSPSGSAHSPARFERVVSRHGSAGCSFTAPLAAAVTSGHGTRRASTSRGARPTRPTPRHPDLGLAPPAADAATRGFPCRQDLRAPA